MFFWWGREVRAISDAFKLALGFLTRLGYFEFINLTFLDIMFYHPRRGVEAKVAHSTGTPEKGVLIFSFRDLFNLFFQP
jgi:hypothetical protein